MLCRPPAPLRAAKLVEEILVRFLPGDPASLLRAALVCKPSCRMVSSEGFCSRFRIVSGEASTDASASPQLLVQARLRGKTWQARTKVRDSRTRMGSVDAVIFSQLMLQRAFRAVDFVGQRAEAVASREDGRGHRLPVHPQKSQLTANRRHNNYCCTCPNNAACRSAACMRQLCARWLPASVCLRPDPRANMNPSFYERVVKRPLSSLFYSLSFT